jgi:CubicO group peptidase (beta-lactamase class C family)
MPAAVTSLQPVQGVEGLADEIDRLALSTDFAGVVRVDRGDELVLAKAFGFADRAHRIDNTLETQFGIASGTKGFTALTIVRLIELGVFDLSTPVRPLLGTDLPLVDDGVTIQHLLTHRSGIGDYLDEDSVGDVTEYVMTVPVHQLATTESYVPVLEGHAQKFAPGTDFAYCNAGYVLLALVAERATGVAFAELVQRHVCDSAGLFDTAFLRSDELPGRAATGYLESAGSRTNVLHLPVRGSGDGGIYSTASDIRALWRAVVAGRVVWRGWVAEMVRPHSDVASQSARYGMGFWLHASTDAIALEGSDAGVSFRSTHRPSTRLTTTVLSNSSNGAWPLARHLQAFFSI